MSAQTEIEVMRLGALLKDVVTRLERLEAAGASDDDQPLSAVSTLEVVQSSPFPIKRGPGRPPKVQT